MNELKLLHEEMRTSNMIINARYYEVLVSRGNIDESMSDKSVGNLQEEDNVFIWSTARLLT